ncbi:MULTISPECIES: LysR substrate-binding domain-containing protein [Cyanophyceae]|uniref:LysR substrate-binding domain-containing protein n=1 Tax=Cyanophyceae TaxID=3028117 RepID=UPI0023310260|nr:MULTISPECIES: LysR substrate-binding domain-containing protein [Cyanophyceae]MDB9340512.1 LysR substrate-binding domain-containing protein [Nodularia spumigena CS-589/07]MDB9400009.1 LysR substrate-binding domain-containing protein [Microcystis aeruginosa CS-567/02-A1]MDB9499891.1 LysR substrate-binding domain-containing protein [Nodularia spumigena CS-336/02]MDB9531443.1 LysR substrate-binding domain-containing protein [Nodularia spumigena CS-1038]
MKFQHLSQFELRQICYFIAVVQAGNNFSEAAKRLGIKQPPLSQRIQALEELLSTDQKTLAVKLFDRSKRPIELTEAGQAFLIEAEQALIHLERAVFHARQASQGEIGRLIIGMNNSIANTILPEIVQEFQQQFPKVALELNEVTIQQQIQMLKHHQLDVIFQRSPSFEQNDPALSFQPILEEYFIVALPTTHALANQTKISLKALADDAIILPSLDVLPFYEKVVTLCREAGFEPKINQTVTASGVVALLSLVAAGVGVSILPNHVQTLHREGVVYRTLQNAPLNRQIAVVWRQEDSSIVLRQFLKVIQKVMNLSLLDSW